MFQSSESLRKLRSELDQGIEAVPAGTYKVKNPFLLLESLGEEDEEPSDLTFPDWRKSGLQPGDRLRVNIVEIESSNTLFLHPDDPSCGYLGKS